MMEPAKDDKDVSVYINVHETSLQDSSSRGRPRQDLEWSEMCENLSSKFADCLGDISKPLPSLLLAELVLATTLLLLSTIPDPWEIGYGAFVYVIVANSLNLVAYILLMSVTFLWPKTVYRPPEIITLALKLIAHVILLLLQFVGFIVMIANMRGHGVQIAYLILTLILCCVLILIIFCYHDQMSHLSEKSGQDAAPIKKKKTVRRKHKGYKKLGRSGYR